MHETTSEQEQMLKLMQTLGAFQMSESSVEVLDRLNTSVGAFGLEGTSSRLEPLQGASVKTAVV